jgi:hypothetical protein
MSGPSRQQAKQSQADLQMAALRKRRKATRFRIHLICGVIVGAIIGFYIWTELPSPSIPAGFKPNVVERFFMAMDSGVGVAIMVVGTALVGGLLAGSRYDNFWTDLMTYIKREVGRD